VLDTLATLDEPLLTGGATLLGALVGALGAIWAGKKAADETAKAELKRQEFARKEQEATRKAAARVVELQLAQTGDQFEKAVATNWLPATFEIPSWEDIRVLSPVLSSDDWASLADAMRWLRYVRTLAAKLAATMPEGISAAGGSQLVATNDIQTDIRDALPHLQTAQRLVNRHLNGVTTFVEHQEHVGA
jgi:hypothetical protein